MSPYKAWGILAVLLAAGIAGCKADTHPIIILCAGDSITERGYPRFLRRALHENHIAASVLNYGRSGHTTAEYLRYLQSKEDKLRIEQPDIVLLELGTNDVRIDGDHVPKELFERNLREIIAIFQKFKSKAGEKPVLLLGSIPPIPKGVPYPFGPESVLRVTLEINPSIRSICESMNIAFVDNFSLFQDRPELLPGVHPSSEGYEAMAKNWLKALKPLMTIRSLTQPPAF